MGRGRVAGAWPGREALSLSDFDFDIAVRPTKRQRKMSRAWSNETPITSETVTELIHPEQGDAVSASDYLSIYTMTIPSDYMDVVCSIADLNAREASMEGPGSKRRKPPVFGTLCLVAIIAHEYLSGTLVNSS